MDFLLNVVQVADRNKIAVGGHSYGAFMTANLLIHASDLFSCGIARSGAYNRTLTPFGFQVTCQWILRHSVLLLFSNFGFLPHDFWIFWIQCRCGLNGIHNIWATVLSLLWQAEERTLWEAQKTYIDMSPYMYADRVKKPILLIHGDEDNNAGTMTMQVHFRTIGVLLVTY